VSADRARSTLERLIPELVGPDDASPLVSTFLRGLAIGALVGAAIAGSAILQRRRSRDDDQTRAVQLPPSD
jgi:hypothetical protein